MKVEIDIDDTTGEIVGDQIPEPLDKVMKRKYDTGFGKGRETAAKDAQRQIDDAIKRAGADPVERERLRQLEDENGKFKLAEAEREKRYDEAIKLREKSHAEDLKAEAAKREKREGRIRELTKKEIRAEAIAAGARDESLDELEELLIRRIGFSDDMDAFVMGDDGQPATDLSIGGFVKAYLDGKPHHRKAATGPGGGARGGATRSGGAPSGNATKDAAFAAAAETPTIQNIGKALSLAGKA